MNRLLRKTVKSSDNFFKKIQNRFKEGFTAEEITAGFLTAGTVSLFLSISFHQIFFGLAFFMVFYLIKKNGLPDLSGKEWVLFLLIVVVHPFVVLLSTWLYSRGEAKHLNYGIEQLFFSIPFFSFFIFNKYVRGDFAEKFIKKIPLIAFWGGILWSLYLLAGAFFFDRPQGPWGNIFRTGRVLSISFFSTGYLFFKYKSVKVKSALILSMFLFLTAIVFTGRRSSFLMIVIPAFAGVAGLLFTKKLRFKTAFIVIGVFFLSMGALLKIPAVQEHRIFETFIPSRFVKNGRFSFYKLNKISSGRYDIARTSFQIVKRSLKNGGWSHLLTGWGFGTLRKNKILYHIKIPLPVKLKAYESGIGPLNEFMNAGIPGLAACLSYFILVFYIFYAAFRSGDMLFMFMSLILLADVIGRNFTWYHLPANDFFLVLFGAVYITFHKPYDKGHESLVC